MNNKISLMLMLMLSFIAIQKMNAQQNYYLSSSQGVDQNTGSKEAPWKSLSKISSTNIQPGDTLFFKRGDRFNGHFVVNGSGTEDSPIVITGFGTGNKPIITGEVGGIGGGDYQEAILVNNNDHIVFDGLEVQNERKVKRAGVNDEKAYGIQILNDGTGVLRNFELRNMTIRNVYAVTPILDPDNFNSLEVAGIRVFSTWNTTNNQKNIQDVLIEDCYFTDLQRFGIHLKHGGSAEGVGNDFINRNANIICRNNEFSYLGGTSILPQQTYNCLIENNIFDHPGASTDPRMPARGSSVWTFRCINTVIQYNQCLSTRGYFDSYGIHIDHHNKNTFIQYNYMEDCEGGFVEILKGNLNSVYRFNVSVNDGFRQHPTWINSNHTIWIDAALHTDNPAFCDSSYIYNNTIIVDKPFTTAIAINAKNTFIFNNIFYSINGGFMGQQQAVVKDQGTTFFMSNNLFHGQIAHDFQRWDQNPIYGDPLFLNEGELENRYQLNDSSIAIKTGVAIDVPVIPGAGMGVFKNVSPYPDVDFFGNLLDWSDTSPNIGVFNGDGIVTSTSNLENNKDFLIYPVPANSKINIKFNSEVNEPIDVSLVDMRGQIIKVQRQLTSGGNNIYSLDIAPDIPGGIYIINVNKNGQFYSRRFVLVR